MSVKPETRFYRGVNAHLPVVVYRAKMSNPFVDGVFDLWYSGVRRDLWMEYKWLPAIPVREHTLVVPDLSAKQRLWGEGRARENRNVRVCIGCPEGGVILEAREWDGLPAREFRARLASRQQVARWLLNFCDGSERE